MLEAIMSILFLILFFLGIILGINALLTQKSITSYVATNKHGHRCYIEGLSYSEREVVDVLAQNLDCKEYYIFNNLILPSDYGISTQIDHVVVSKYGIFVIESKDYNGWIFGSVNSKKWTQCLPRGYKFQFQNPLRQNWGHVTALKALLPFVGENIYNVVVFSDNCEFKTPRISNVLFLSELADYIKKWRSDRLDEQNMLMAIGKLSYLCQAIDITLEEHVNNVKNTIGT